MKGKGGTSIEDLTKILRMQPDLEIHDTCRVSHATVSHASITPHPIRAKPMYLSMRRRMSNNNE